MVVYHLVPSAIPAGYVGVDVFFVISGFLITGQLVRSAERHGRPRLLEFWGRRARRLLPAAALVLTVTWSLSRQLLPATRLPAAAEQVRASALYVQNWVLAHDSVDYLTSADSPSPVQHFWSLSVEEQFYLGWPLLLVLAGLAAYRSPRVSRAGALLVACAVFGASLGWGIRLTGSDPAAAYFVTTTRVWELAAGAALALAPARLTAALGRYGWPAWLGLAAVLGSAWLFDATTPFPGVAALLPVGGTLAVLACGGRTASRGPAALTRTPALVFLGDISYSLYLWHWPLIVLWQAHTGHPVDAADGVGIAATAVALAWLTTVCVENPVRRARVLAISPIRSLATAAAVVVPVGLAATYTPPVLHRIQLTHADAGAAAAAAPTSAPPSGRAPSASRPDPPTPSLPVAIPRSPMPPIDVAAQDVAPYSQCETPPDEVTPRPCSYGPRRHARLRVVLVGDSVANQFRSLLVDLATKRHWLVITDLHSECPWTATMLTLQHSGVPYSVCHEWGVQALHDIVTSYRPDVLITTDRPTLGTVRHTAADPTAFGEIADGMVRYWRQVAAATGARIIGIRETPEPGRNIPDCLSRPGATMRSCSTSPARAIVAHSPIQQAVASMGAGAEEIDLNSHICYPSVCPPIIGNVVVYRDTHHLTQTYIHTLEPYFDRALLGTSAVRGR